MHTIHTRRRKGLVAAVAVAALATTLAACGSGSTSSSNKTTSSGNGSSTVSVAQALIDKATSAAVTGSSFGIVPADQITTWKQSDIPTPAALPAKPIKVDVVIEYPVGFPTYANQLTKAIGEKLGWTVNLINAATPDPQGAIAALQQAVLDKPDAIIAEVIPGIMVAPALTAAKAAGIKTVLVHQDDTTGPGYDAYVPLAEGVQKALVGAWIVAKSGGKGSAMVVDSPAFTDANVASTIQYLKNCAGCTVLSKQVSPDQVSFAAQGQTAVAALLAAAAPMDYLTWPNGSVPLQGLINAISASKNPKTQILINDPEAEAIQLLKAGKLPMVVETPEALSILESIDDVSRLVQGQAPLAEDALRFPISIWTKDTAPDPTNSAVSAAQLKASDWLTPFEKAWGVSLKDTVLSVN